MMGCFFIFLGGGGLFAADILAVAKSLLGREEDKCMFYKVDLLQQKKKNSDS